MSQITNTTFDFLNDLKENNHKEWFQANKKRYEASHAEVIAFADELLSQVNEFDVIETASGKKSLMRIYRDIRFSKDKTPYKSHWAGGFRRAGADRRGGMYFHIQPGNKSMIGGGFWGPNKEDLLLIRNQIASDAQPLRDVLSSEAFTSYFGRMNGEQVKTAPKGFAKDHENIDLLKYKQYLISKTFSDDEVLSADFVGLVAKGFKQMLPFFDCFTDYLTTTLNGESII